MRIIWPAMTSCWIWLVPSYSRNSRTSRYSRSTALACMHRRPEHNWTVPELAQQWRVFRFDLPGHGGSAPPIRG